MIQKPRGTEDLFGEKINELEALEYIIKNVMSIFNYKKISTPVFEATNLFKRSVGELSDVVSKEMFEFKDKKGREFALKPEGTAPIVRSIIENKLYIPERLPLKLFYISNMFRYERPQAGRQRQFRQLGVEAFGLRTPEIDSEIVILADYILKSIGIKNFTLHVNYIVGGSNRKKYIEDLKIYLKSKDVCSDCDERIEKNTLRVLDCKIDEEKFKDVIDMRKYLSEEDELYFTSVLDNLKNVGIVPKIDKNLVRGLDYYTGFVFEIRSISNKLTSTSTLVGGGRYDNLVKELGGPVLPAIGFGMGLERILLTLEENNLKLSNKDSLDAYIIALSNKSTKFAVILSQMLRNANIKSDFCFLTQNLKNAFKYAERLNSRNIIIVGEKELKENNVIIKNQLTKKEEKVAFENIIDKLNEEN